MLTESENDLETLRRSKNVTVMTLSKIFSALGYGLSVRLVKPENNIPGQLGPE